MISFQVGCTKPKWRKCMRNSLSPLKLLVVNLTLFFDDFVKVKGAKGKTCVTIFVNNSMYSLTEGVTEVT
jgi:hypothetical protein